MLVSSSHDCMDLLLYFPFVTEWQSLWDFLGHTTSRHSVKYAQLPRHSFFNPQMLHQHFICHWTTNFSAAHSYSQKVICPWNWAPALPQVGVWIDLSNRTASVRTFSTENKAQCHVPSVTWCHHVTPSEQVRGNAFKMNPPSQQPPQHWEKTKLPQLVPELLFIENRSQRR